MTGICWGLTDVAYREVVVTMWIWDGAEGGRGGSRGERRAPCRPQLPLHSPLAALTPLVTLPPPTHPHINTPTHPTRQYFDPGAGSFATNGSVLQGHIGGLYDHHMAEHLKVGTATGR